MAAVSSKFSFLGTLGLLASLSTKGVESKFEGTVPELSEVSPTLNSKLFVCLHVCVHVHAHKNAALRLWMSEDNCSPYHVGPRE